MGSIGGMKILVPRGRFEPQAAPGMAICHTKANLYSSDQRLGGGP